ncbi:MAG: hypothetical protein IPG10_01390 [Flavobacteriales bacterium]|jgi:hypothetical protein|nr:hypothetical protein [Flavobacteriales bacterium]MBK6753149.1 hypothetical protein [Flavobacteriales bacterium]MBK7269815.1 hypothetical protein [Flavobacteriales bacterium]MBK7752659.1 hypothetical protein [Flavobacteriales bacterium]MBK9076670.1 hypothetical protein [Flavobacteriales bacterium]
MSLRAALRSLIVLVALTTLTSNTFAAPVAKGNKAEKTAKATHANKERRMVAAFVDPTTPLAELVERERAAMLAR